MKCLPDFFIRISFMKDAHAIKEGGWSFHSLCSILNFLISSKCFRIVSMDNGDIDMDVDADVDRLFDDDLDANNTLVFASPALDVIPQVGWKKCAGR